MHFSVGAVIRRDGKFLLLDRMKPPFGFAGPAGHVLGDEDPVEALKREVEREVGLKVVDQNLLFDEEVERSWCSQDITAHHWYLFDCTVSGAVIPSSLDAKSIGWFSKEEIQDMKIEFMWQYWLGKMGVIQTSSSPP